MRWTCCVVMVLVTVAARADEPLVLKLWPGGAPGEKEGIGEEKFLDNRPEEKNPIRRLTNVTQPTVTIYRPAKEKDTGTAIIIAPGGGYSILAWNHEGEEVAAWLNKIGVTGVLLKYRVPRRPDDPKNEPPPAPLQDAQRAVSLVRSKAKELGIRPDRIGMLGFSAGGHLAAATSTRFDKRSYEPKDEIDQVSPRPDFSVLIYPAYLVTKAKEGLREDIRVTKEAPPAILIHAANDPVTMDSSLQYFRALRRAGVASELHIYTAGGHGFGIRPSSHPIAGWPQRCEEWMRAQGYLAK